MQFTEQAGIVAGCIATLAFVFYIYDLVKNPEKDKSLTAWIIWTFVGYLIYSTYMATGHEDETSASGWVPFIYMIFPPIILAILFFYCKSRKANFDWWDKILLATTLLSGIYFFCFGQATLPLHMNIFVDLSGAFAVAKGAWNDPRGEPKLAWVSFNVANGLNCLAITKWEYDFYIYPVSIFVASIIILAIILFRPEKNRRVLD